VVKDMNVQSKGAIVIDRLTHLINQEYIKHDAKELTQTLKNLSTLKYNTSDFLVSIAQAFQPVNNSFRYRLEVKEQAKYFKMQHRIRKNAAYVSFAGKGLLWTSVPNAIFSIGYNHIINGYTHKINALKRNLYLNAQKQKKSDGLKEHRTNNYAPIACSVDNPSLPLYEPKTIVDFCNIKRRLPNKKTHDKILKQLNYVANLSDDARGHYLTSLTEGKFIDAQECKKHNWPQELIGQKGIFAIKDIPAWTVLGYYSGIYFTTHAERETYEYNNGDAFKTYVYSLPDVDMPRISAFMYGNDLSLINAGTVYVGTAYSIAHELFEKCSVSCVYAKSLEYPDTAYVDDPEKFDLVSYVTNRDIKKGEQLLINYGYNYWSHRLDNCIDTDTDAIYTILDDLWQKRKNSKKTFSKIYNRK
jgi:hypothetical protein